MEKKAGLLEKAAEGIVYIYTILMIGVFPLFYKNGYFGLIEVKTAFFRKTAIMLCILVFCCYMGSIPGRIRRKEFVHRESRPWKKIKWNQWMIAVFAVAVGMSVFLSPYETVWKGTRLGRYMGGEALLLCMAVYLITAKYLRAGMGIIWTYLIANMLEFLLLILNFWGIDILKIRDRLTVGNDAAMFQGTIGNVDYCAAYICMVLAVGMVLYYLSEEKLSRRIYGGFLVLGFYAAYAVLAESWILGVGTAYGVLLLVSLKDSRHMRRFMETYALFWMAGVLMAVSVGIGKFIGIDNKIFVLFQVEKVRNLLINKYLLVGTGILLLIGMKKDIDVKKVRKVLAALFILAVTALIPSFIIANSSQKEWSGGAVWLNLLRFTDDFANHRGFYWRLAVTGFWDFPIQHKLFGYGANCYNNIMYEMFQAQIMEHQNMISDAHNEFLQLLVTTGITGVCGYFGLILGTVVSAVKRMKNNPLLLLAVVVLPAYLAQGLVNGLQIYTTPLLFLLLGIIASKIQASAA